MLHVVVLNVLTVKHTLPCSLCAWSTFVIVHYYDGTFRKQSLKIPLYLEFRER